MDYRNHMDNLVSRDEEHSIGKPPEQRPPNFAMNHGKTRWCFAYLPDDPI